MAVEHADDPGNCPDPLTTPDQYMGGFCATNFTSGPAAGKFCWDQQPEYSALRESSFGHGILEVLSLSLSLQASQPSSNYTTESPLKVEPNQLGFQHSSCR
jgi:hypothetical protein